MKDNAPVDPKIIESIKQWKCFQCSGPRKNVLALSAPGLAKFETTYVWSIIAVSAFHTKKITDLFTYLFQLQASKRYRKNC